MEFELENNDFKRGNYHQQQMNPSVNPNQIKLGYQLQKHQMNLSSMESAATSEASQINSSLSLSKSERKSLKQKSKNSQKQKEKYKNKKNKSTSQGRSKSKSSRSSSRSRSQQRRRTPSPWPRRSQQINKKNQHKNNKHIGAGLTAIQNKTCKYWKQGYCNQPTKCPYAHYQFGKIIQEHKKEFSNFTNLNQQIREGQIMVKLTVFKLMGEEELKNPIRDQTEYSAKEIEISYQCAKQYKKMKKAINQTKKDIMLSQNEKKINIRQTAYDSIFFLQINNNEKNAAQKQEAQQKRKERREEKRVQNQLLKQNQQQLQNNIINIINQNFNASNQLIQKQNEYALEIEEINNQQNDLIQSNNINKYASLINQNQTQSEEIESDNNYDAILHNNYIEQINQLEKSQPANKQIEINANQQSQPSENQRDETQVNQLMTLQETHINNSNQQSAATQYIQTSQNKSNKFRQQQLNFLINQPQISDRNQKLNEFINEKSPKAEGQPTHKSQFQLFKELRKNVNFNQKSDLIKDEALMDSVQSVDSITMKEMELKYSKEQLYDWKFICLQKLYTSSDTQNVFNLKKIEKESYNQNQLISYNSNTKLIDMMNINSNIKQSIKQQILTDQSNQNIFNLIVIIKKDIADQIFSQYAIEEIRKQLKEIDQAQEDKSPGINDIHIFTKIIAQFSSKIVNINFAKDEDPINMNSAVDIFSIAEFIKLELADDFFFKYELASEEKRYKIYAIKQNNDPTPFFQKKYKQIFQ